MYNVAVMHPNFTIRGNIIMNLLMEFSVHITEPNT